MPEKAIRDKRHELGIVPVYKRVDTCAGEFATATAYLYSTYEEECEADPTKKPKIMILGGGPNRIGQGIEFDYCCVHAALQLREVGFPLIVRPSYVLGGRAMEVVFNEEDLRAYMTHAMRVSNDSPVLLDRFLDVAIEVDVDAVCDGEDVLIGGIMEHIEQAGVHSGDSGCSLPPNSLTREMQSDLRDQTRKLPRALNVVGLMNVQFAIQSGVIYVLEVNPRASRTVPFVSKATGLPLAKIAARVMTGRKLRQLVGAAERVPGYFSVKEAVFPFTKFPEADPILGPEMKSTGEVMGTGRTFGEAYAKAQSASGVVLPRHGVCFISVRDRDKGPAVMLARKLIERGFELVATEGTARALSEAGGHRPPGDQGGGGRARLRRTDQ